MKKNFLFIFVFVFLICTNKTYALEVGQKIEDNHTIYSINSMDIYIKNNKIQIENFLSNQWRTYVKLSDLCSKEFDICEISDINSDKMTLIRKYENKKDVYYKTEYTYKNNKYNSVLSVPNSLSFSFGNTEITPDVKPVKLDEEVYVPIRFVIEALGAEVKYENKGPNENATIKIDFYSDKDLDLKVDFFDISTLQGNDYSTMKKYDFKDLKNNGCYDIVVQYKDLSIYNIKLFSENKNFIKINYNNDVQTNICLHDKPKDKSLSLVFNYKNVPLVYEIDESNINEVELDKIYLSGNMEGISKYSEVEQNVIYSGTTLNFDKYATLKWQGHSSIAYDKKNYTIKLFEDKNRKDKYKININEWGKRNKYCLKANYIDYTQSRNVVSAKLWGEVVDSRDNLNPNLKGLTNGGAIDGYPVLLYINDERQGLYTLNTCKDENLFTGKNEPIALYSSNHFTKDIWFSNEETHTNTGFSLEPWDLEHLSKDANENEINNSLQEMVTFIFDSSDEEFKTKLNNYLDVDAAIDYMLFMYYINGSDNAAINTLWVTYDGKIWIPSAYDMDATYGLAATGRKYLDYDYMIPTKYNNKIYSNSNMVLWDRLLNNFSSKIKARYNKLRKDVLTLSNIKNKFNSFVKSIPRNAYYDDYYIWNGTTIIDNEKMVTWENESNNDLITNELNKIFDYIKNREKLLDEIMNKM